MQRVRRLEVLDERWAANGTRVSHSDAVELAQRAGITPDPWQAAVLRSDARQILLNCSRQSGKSLVSAVLAAHTAQTKAGSLSIILAPSQRQSIEVFRRVVGINRASGEPIPPEAESSLRLELRNGARVVALPGRDDAAVRGFSAVDLLVIDEASRVSDQLYLSLRPVLAVSGGRLLALSTPFGARGWWYEAWHSDEAWERYLVPASECPRISPAFLEEERRALGSWWFGQEYECQFLDAQDAVFRQADIDAALVDLAPLFGTPPALPSGTGSTPAMHAAESNYVVIEP